MSQRLTTQELILRLGRYIILQFVSSYLLLENISVKNWFWVGVFGTLTMLSTRASFVTSRDWKNPRQ
jgi:hypothetical protein